MKRKHDDLILTIHALSAQERLQILLLLKKRAHCVCEIQKELNLNQTGASNHLSVLYKAQLIEPKQVNRFRYYNLSDNYKELILEIETIFKNSE